MTVDTAPLFPDDMYATKEDGLTAQPMRERSVRPLRPSALRSISIVFRCRGLLFLKSFPMPICRSSRPRRQTSS